MILLTYLFCRSMCCCCLDIKSVPRLSAIFTLCGLTFGLKVKIVSSSSMRAAVVRFIGLLTPFTLLLPSLALGPMLRSCGFDDPGVTDGALIAVAIFELALICYLSFTW